MIAFISTSQSRQREMFTMAHELGHAALYMVDPKIDQSGAEAERVCDIFAAELIMPIKFVRATWRSIPDVEAVIRVMNKCGASLPASCRRIAEYLGDACVGIVSDSGIIQEEYGISVRQEIESVHDLAPTANLTQTFSIDIRYGLTLSLRRIGKERVIFLARKIVLLALAVRGPCRTEASVHGCLLTSLALDANAACLASAMLG